MTVIIGIDPHKGSHTATALGANLTELGTIRGRSREPADWASCSLNG